MFYCFVRRLANAIEQQEFQSKMLAALYVTKAYQVIYVPTRQAHKTHIKILLYIWISTDRETAIKLATIE